MFFLVQGVQLGVVWFFVLDHAEEDFQEQQSQTAFPSKTLRAAGRVPTAGVGSVLTARCGDALARVETPSPPWPQPKSLAAALRAIFRPALRVIGRRFSRRRAFACPLVLQNLRFPRLPSSRVVLYSFNGLVPNNACKRGRFPTARKATGEDAHRSSRSHCRILGQWEIRILRF